MNFPAIFFLTIIILILAVDKIFMPKHARKAWQMMAIAYSFAILFALFPDALSRFASFIGVGRGVDVIIYCLIFVLVREVFISRSRQNSSDRQITILTRQIAIDQAKLVSKNNSKQYEIEFR